MPVYVYKNLTTGETFEVQQSIKESAWTEHPETGDPVKRIVQPVGIAFKGSGFYVTDSRAGSKGKAVGAKPSSNGEASGGGDAAAKPDAKDGGAKDGGAKNGGAKDTSSSSKAASGGGSSGSSTSSSS